LAPVNSGNADNCAGYTSPSAVAYSANGDTGVSLPARGYPNFDPANPPPGTSMIAVNRHSKTSMVEEWNLQVEHQFGSNNTLNVAYVGTVGNDLSSYYPYNINQFKTGIQNFPGLGGINYNDYNGISNYNGLQIHGVHRGPTG